MRLTPEQLQAARAVCEAATPGEWESYFTFVQHRDSPIGRKDDPSYGGIAEAAQMKDAKFIAAARTGWPAALDMIAELQDRNEDLEMAVDSLRKAHENMSHNYHSALKIIEDRTADRDRWQKQYQERRNYIDIILAERRRLQKMVEARDRKGDVCKCTGTQNTDI